MSWKLTVRAGPKVRQRSFAALDQALDALELGARELADSAPGQPRDVRLGRFEAVQRVSARLEISGPERFVSSHRAGVDVHGDGSVQAYSGRIRREAIGARGHETPYAALRRVLGEG